MKKFNILNYKTESQIKEIVTYLGEQPLKQSSHGYTNHGSIKIIDSANKSTKDYTSLAKRKPALALIGVILAANRNYNKVVEPNIKRLDESSFKSFNELSKIIELKSKEEFFSFWGPKDQKKYNTLCSILNVIPKIKKVNNHTTNDFALLNSWAQNASLSNKNKDIIGSLPNIGIATYQHLKMVFGVETIKPDQRVKEVLDFEFGIEKLNDFNSILAVEQMAKIINLNVLTLDQIFVKYGSGYYNKVNSKLSVKDIAKKLKENNVDARVIRAALNLSLHQINRL